MSRIESQYLSTKRTSSPCGCSVIFTYNEDPNFDGYDSDGCMTDYTRVYCEKHEAELDNLKQEENDIFQRMFEIQRHTLHPMKKRQDVIRDEIEAIDAPLKSIKSEEFKQRPPIMKPQRHIWPSPYV